MTLTELLAVVDRAVHMEAQFTPYGDTEDEGTIVDLPDGSAFLIRPFDLPEDE